MLSLVYVSSASHTFSTPELVELLAKARANNALLNISGILLYQEKSFIQVLEGPENAVRATFHKVSADPRHHGVIRLLETRIEQRQFADWSMGLRNLMDPELRALPGFNEFLNQPFTPESLQQDPSRAVRLLNIFRKSFTS